ncbi:12775_t:CDS:2 [Entrophospora sp. SA101]|nr:12775_t:CDS:2 [Entrophospora sp. SA101]
MNNYRLITNSIDLFGNESNSESIDTGSDIDPENYEYYDNHNRDIDFLIEDYIDLNDYLFNYEGSNKNEIDIKKKIINYECDTDEEDLDYDSHSLEGRVENNIGLYESNDESSDDDGDIE